MCFWSSYYTAVCQSSVSQASDPESSRPQWPPDVCYTSPSERQKNILQFRSSSTKMDQNNILQTSTSVDPQSSQKTFRRLLQGIRSHYLAQRIAWFQWKWMMQSALGSCCLPGSSSCPLGWLWWGWSGEQTSWLDQMLVDGRDYGSDIYESASGTPADQERWWKAQNKLK